jgi:hypothetical protein
VAYKIKERGMILPKCLQVHELIPPLWRGSKMKYSICAFVMKYFLEERRERGGEGWSCVLLTIEFTHLLLQYHTLNESEGRANWMLGMGLQISLTARDKSFRDLFFDIVFNNHYAISSFFLFLF